METMSIIKNEFFPLLRYADVVFLLVYIPFKCGNAGFFYTVPISSTRSEAIQKKIGIRKMRI